MATPARSDDYLFRRLPRLHGRMPTDSFTLPQCQGRLPRQQARANAPAQHRTPGSISFFSLISLLIVTGMIISQTAKADLYWDGQNTTANGVIDGGFGDWNAGNTNWTNATGTVNTTWIPGETAIFSTVGANVSVPNGIDLLGIQFNTNTDLSGPGPLTGTSPTTTLFAGPGISLVHPALAGQAYTITGGGILYLYGNNTYTGVMTISAGQLVAAHNSALGTTAGGTTVSSGAALGLTNGITISNEALTINGTGAGSLGALFNQSGDNTYAGAITLGSASTIGSSSGTLTVSSTVAMGANALSVNGDGNTNLGGVVSGAGSLTKSGAGTLTLGASNSYTGATSISAGTVIAANANALGATSNGTTVSSGGALGLSGGITFAAEPLTINGTGVNSSGALYNSSGSNIYTGAVTLGSASTIGNSSTGTLSMSGGVGMAANILTLDGTGATNISGVISGTNAGGLTKTGTGTAKFTASNTYTGATTVSGGTLELNGSGLGSYVSSSTTVASGATLKFINTAGVSLPTTSTFTFNDGSKLDSSVPSTMVVNGPVTTNGAVELKNTTAAAGNSLDRGFYFKGGLAGGGTLTLTASNQGNAFNFYKSNNAFTGSITVNGIANTASNSGSGIGIGGSLTTLGGVNFTINGTMELGSGGIGWANDDYDSTIGALNGTGVVINNTGGMRILTIGNTDSDGTFSGIIGTTNIAITKAGTGKQTLSGTNTYGGVTRITKGILIAANSRAMGNPNSSTAATVLTSGASLGLSGGVTIPLGQSLYLNGSGFAQTVNSITTSLGALYNVDSNNSYAAGIALQSASAIANNSTGVLTLTNDSTFTMGGYALTFDNTGDINVNRAMTGGTSLTKTGSGTLTLGAVNSYNSTTTVSGGTVALGIDSALPVASLVTVAAGAKLDIGTKSQTLSAGLTIVTSANTATTAHGALVCSTNGALTLSGGASSIASITGPCSITVSGTNTTLTLPESITNTDLKITLGDGAKLILTAGKTYSFGTLVSTGASSIDFSSSTTAWVNLTVQTLTPGTGTNDILTASNWTQDTTNSSNRDHFYANAVTGNPVVNKYNQSPLNKVALGTNAAVLTFWKDTELLAGNSAGLVYWDGPSSNNATQEWGSGTWSSTGSNWTNSDSTINGTWPGSNNVAIFAGTQGTGTAAVTVNGAQSIGGITFNTNGYALSGTGSFTLADATNNKLTAASGVSATIANVITGATPLEKAGDGTITLSGSNTYTGATKLSAGMLELSGSGFISHASATSVLSGATLKLTGAAGSSASNNQSATFNLGNGAKVEVSNAGQPIVLYQLATIGGNANDTVDLKITSPATTVGNQGFYFRKWAGKGTLNIDAGAAGNAVNFYKSDNGTFTGKIVVNGIASTTAYAGSGIGIGGSAQSDGSGSTLAGVDFTINGTMELGTAGIGWANDDYDSTIGALNGTGVVINNTAGMRILAIGATGSDGTFSGIIGTTNIAIKKVGLGKQTFSGVNTYKGNTNITQGILIAANSNAMGNAQGATYVTSGASLGLSGGVTIPSPQTLYLNGSGFSQTVNGITTNFGALYNASGNNSYASNITLQSASTIANNSTGILTLNNTGTFPTDYAVTFDNSGAINVNRAITGAAAITKTGSGILTLADVNTYAGITTINGGTLQVGGGGTDATTGATTASIDSNASTVVAKDALLKFNRSNTYTSSKIISGEGNLEQAGTGTTSLTAINTYTGTTKVSGGTLALRKNGSNVYGQLSTDTAVTVDAGATLDLGAASQTLSKGLTVNGTLACSTTAGEKATLTLNGDTNNTIASITGHCNIIVSGSNTTLTLSDNIANTDVNITLAGGKLIFKGGKTYSLGEVVQTAASTIDLDSSSTSFVSLTVAKLTPGASTDGNTLYTLTVDNWTQGSDHFYATAVTGNPAKSLLNQAPLNRIPLGGNDASKTYWTSTTELLVGDPTTMVYWDGPSADKTSVEGGAGTWSAAATNWTNSTGTLNGIWPGAASVAIFAGTAGTVTVDSPTTIVNGNTVTISAGIGGLTFNTTAYTLSGGSLMGTSTTSNALTADTGISATIGTVLLGGSTNPFEKKGAGTIIFTGTNTYTGSTTVSAGTLQIGAGGTSGSIDSNSNTIIASGALLKFNRSDAYTSSKVISGAGNIEQAGSGATTLSGANTYTGSTKVSAGTLRVGANNTIPASSAVTVDSGATLDLNSLQQTLSVGLTVNGTLACGTNGKLTLTAGNSSIAAITGSCTIEVSSGAMLTLSADITNTSANITLNGGQLILVKGKTYSLGTLTLGADSTVDMDSATDAFVSLTVSTLATGTYKLNVSNWLQDSAQSGKDHFYATAISPAESGDPAVVKGKLNIKPLNQIALGTSLASVTYWSGVTATNTELLVGDVTTLTYWDGPATNTTSIEGGAATWDGTGSNWTNSTGDLNGIWPGSTKIATFQGTAGAVSVSGTQSMGGLTFSTTGYTLSGGTLTGASGNNILTASANVTATIGSVLAGGTNGYEKQGAGTIILTGVNTYTGATKVSAGTLALGKNGGADGQLSANSSVTVDAGATLDLGTVSQTLNTAVSIAGSLACSSASGESGTLTLTSGSNSIANITGNCTIVISGASTTLTLPESISNTGANITLNGGKLILVKDKTYSLGTVSQTAASTIDMDAAGAVNLTVAKLSPGGVALTVANWTKGTTNDVFKATNATDTSGNTVAQNKLNVATLTVIKLGANDASVTYWDATTSELVVGDASTLTYWDGPASSNTTIEGGIGTWDATTSNWANSAGSLNGVWPGSTKVATFQGAAGAVTVSGTQSMGGLTFSTTGYTLSGGTLNGADTANILTAATSVTATVGSVLSGSAYEKKGAGTIVLSGINTYTGSTKVTTGTLKLGANNAIPTTSAVTVASGATLDLDVYQQSLSGLTVDGTLACGTNGKLTLTGGNNSIAAITGSCTIEVSGTTTTLTLPESISNTSANITLNGGKLILVKDKTYSLGTVSQTAASTIDMDAAGAVNLTVAKLSPGGVALTVANWTKGTTNDVFKATNATDTAGATVAQNKLNVATLTVIKLGANDASVTYWEASGNELLVGDASTLTYWDGAASSNTTIEGGNGTWDATAGNWTNSSGSLNGIWPGSTKVATFSGTAGSVSVSGTQSIGGLTFTTNGYILSGNSLTGAATTNILTAGTGISATIGNVLAGSAIEKQGAGTITLTGFNTYTGSTTVTAGTLAIHKNGSTDGQLPSGTTVTVNTGATLDIGNTSQSLSNAVNIAGTLACSSVSGESGTLTLTGGNSVINNITGNCTIVVSGASTTLTLPADLANTNANITLSGGKLILVKDKTYSLGTVSLTAASTIDMDAAGVVNLTVAKLAPGGNNLAVSNWTQGTTSDVFKATNVTDTTGTTVAQNKMNVATLTKITLGANSPTLTYWSKSTTELLIGDTTKFTYWDGAAGNAETIEGGNGTWDATSSNWVNSTGDLNGLWSGGTKVATFQGAAGAVTVSGTQSMGGLTFSTTGYTLSGGTLNGADTANILTAATSVTATVGSVLSGSAYEKKGAGTIVLSGINTYTGSTKVTTGTLKLGANNAIPTTSAVTVASGATLDLDVYQQSLSGLTVDGTLACGTNGKLTLTGGNNSIAAITGSCTIEINSGATLTLTADITNTSANITLNGGKLILVKDKTYSLGTLAQTAASTVDMDAAGVVSLTVATLTPSTFAMTVSNWAQDTNGGDHFYATTVTGNPTQNKLNVAPLNVITLGGADAGLTYWSKLSKELLVGDPSKFVYWDGPAADTETIEGGTAGWNATASNWTNSDGSLNGVWPGSTKVAIFGGTAGTVTIPSTYAPSMGGLTFTTTGYTLTGNSLTAAATTANNILTAGAGVDATIESVLAGATANVFEKLGAGTISLKGINTYTGKTIITEGTLQVVQAKQMSSEYAIAAGATFEIKLTADTIYLPLAAVKLSGKGTLRKTGNFSLSFCSVDHVFAMDVGGLVDVEGGTLNASCDKKGDWTSNKASLNVAAGATFLTNEAGVFVDALTGSGTVKSVYEAATYPASGLTIGVANTDGEFSGAIQDGSVPSATNKTITKVGTGKQTLSGASNYIGLTTINAGTLIAKHGTALGATTGGTTVASGASLGLSGGITIGAEPLTLSGTGVGTTTGALYNVDSSNSFAGAITLAAATTIKNDTSGTMTLGGTIASAGFGLTFDGSGNTAANGIISGAGSLTKVGAGTLTLGAANTYSGGTTTVSAGSLKLSTNNALPTASTVTVAQGATLDLGEVSQTLSNNLTVNGTLACTTEAGKSATLTLSGAANTITAIAGNCNIVLNANATLTLPTGIVNQGVNIKLSGAGSKLQLTNAQTYNLGALELTDAGTLDMAVETGNTYVTLTVSNLNLNGKALTVSNWTMGKDKFTATTFTGAAVATINIAPMNLIAMGPYDTKYTAWMADKEVTVMLNPKVKIALTSKGGVGKFLFALNGLNATTDTITTTVDGTAVNGISLTGTNGTKATITQSASPAGWSNIPLTATCKDANGATNTNGTSDIGTLDGGMLTIPAVNMIAGADFTCSITNQLNGLGGTIFNDSGAPVNGTNTGTPNDGIKNGSETGVAGVTVALTDCNATVYTVTKTDGDGVWGLSIPSAVASGATVCVLATLPANSMATSANAGGTVIASGSAPAAGSYTYSATSTSQSVRLAAPSSGAVNLSFGLVSVSTLATDMTSASTVGKAVEYSHKFTAGTGGTVTFSTSNTPSPSLNGWTSQIYTDATCSGSRQANATVITGPVTVVQGQTYCIVLQVQVPAGASNGYTNATTVTASLALANTAPTVSASYSSKSTTTVGSSDFSLLKSVRNVTTNDSWSSANTAKSGDILEYRLTYTNQGASPITAVVIADAIPSYTTFESAQAESTPAALGTCLKNTPANPAPGAGVSCATTQAAGGTGDIKWAFDGTLAPGTSGSVLFRVKLE